MGQKIKKIALLTGGGDCPGLNAVIRAVTKTAILNYGIEVIGYKFGYRGLYNNDFVSLNLDSVAGILHRGGTILYSSNKDNLFDYLVEENGVMVKKDVSDVANENLKREGVDVLVVIGGDGTLTSARDFARKGVNVIGVPKTIDNDLSSTDVTFGFNTAIDVATEALDRLHTTAESHHRIMICEVMGRNAGYIALWCGIANGAEDILLPELYSYDEEALIDHIIANRRRGKKHHIIINAEGVGHSTSMAKRIEAATGIETRATILGHLQRGGSPTAKDRVMASVMGAYAVDALMGGKSNRVVAYKDGKYVDYDIEEALAMQKELDPFQYSVAKILAR